MKPKVVTESHANGRKSAEGSYVAGEKHGKWTTWDDLGQILSEGEYQKGVKQGVWIEAFLDPATSEWLEARGMRVGGERQGLWTTRTRRGGTVEEIEYKDDRKHGAVTRYFAGERPRERGTYREGLPHGMWTTWHENGTKAREGEMENGDEVGVWRAWAPDGKPEYEVDHDSGAFARWKPDGSVDKGIDPALKRVRVD